ncbi:MAG: NAD(P)-dependent oxidoreductase [Actinomycetota bacterium]|nr:NAD(P)-dependent oxidoreductase [Actinomycetota bacterium]
MADPERILLSGSNGFFGSWIRRALSEAGHDVVAGTRSGVDGTIRLDLDDPGSVARAVAETGPTVIVNAAGISSPAAARKDPGRCFAANTGGTLNLLEAIRTKAPDARLVTLSSAAVYGAGTDDRLDEEEPPAPHSIYGASKLAAEVLCGQYIRERGAAITTLRVFNLVGPGQPGDQASAEFTGAVRRALEAGRPDVEITVGDPGISRDYTDVRDAAAAVAAVIGSGGQGIFNLCSGEATSLADLGDTLSGLATTLKGAPFAVRLRRDPARTSPGDPHTICGSGERLRTATGWSPKTPLSRSLADLLAA